MSGVWPSKPIEAFGRHLPLGRHLLSCPRGAPDRGGGTYTVTRVRRDEKGRLRPELARTHHGIPLRVEVWHRPWHRRLWRFLTGRC